MNDHTSVDHPVIKIISAWAMAFGLSSWSDFAAFLAAVYSLLLISEWFWKRFWRPMLERQGVLKPKQRRRVSDKGL